VFEYKEERQVKDLTPGCGQSTKPGPMAKKRSFGGHGSPLGGGGGSERQDRGNNQQGWETIRIGVLLTTGRRRAERKGGNRPDLGPKKEGGRGEWKEPLKLQSCLTQDVDGGMKERGAQYFVITAERRLGKMDFLR